MENRDDELFSPVTGKKSDDVIRGGHQLVTRSGKSESCAEAGEDEGAGPSLKGEVISCHGAERAGSCGGGASGGTHLYLDKTQEAVTSDLSPDSDEVFTTGLSPPPGEQSPPPSAPASAPPSAPASAPTSAPTSAPPSAPASAPPSAPASAPPSAPTSAPPQSRNTFACGQSAAGQLIQEETESELQSRRPDILEFFSSRKQRSVSVAGWKLFGKVSPKQSPSRQPRVIQQEFEARQVHSSPTRQSGQQSRRGAELEPLSTTALILEDRPANLPAKSTEETQRHREEYELMVAGARRRELKEAQRRQQQREDRLRQEEQISNNSSIWIQEILPQWDHMRWSRRACDLWWAGLPPSVRGRVWSLTIGNELNITAELYNIFLCRAREKGRSPSDATESPEGAWPADRESGVDLITRDVSRTFPSLGVFQEGGPYHDLLQSILGAYTCYRPDVGYVQGMASVAAMLLLNMAEVDAFISFSNLMNRPCQLAFARGDHQQMLRYFAVFQLVLEETLPRLFLHFQSLALTPDLYLMDWIISLYTKPLPLDVACRVWDVFFRDGEEFLFRAALGILRMNQELLLELDLISIAQFLSRPPEEELLSDRLFSCISATPTLKWSQVLSSYRASEQSADL